MQQINTNGDKAGIAKWLRILADELDDPDTYLIPVTGEEWASVTEHGDHRHVQFNIRTRRDTLGITTSQPSPAG